MRDSEDKGTQGREVDRRLIRDSLENDSVVHHVVTVVHTREHKGSREPGDNYTDIT